ncbi:G-type lectin S-receptor-like serine/threonine-protein kinase At1g11330 isoform X6 [Brachypodium distachyon]|uniref:G-type lectin S-receptor-like serine/threonine-protein kinase At1g11330 isoform X6 n=1 Tax=Brachypodium distachyon TaxID=15368 RepID=UPI000D0CE57C|nr:G-type lectin S-receptor-like serine/threonine-protein kinase At1g11330 isoform X6 [Brachypodium distachyon]|eukprot:XP_024311516.1 G-type lectin S-receptor-like serine/threonine-protein kinase At1g11330 isoform X6 [Brachypodium distachyon]
MAKHYIILIFFLLLISSFCKSDDQLTRTKPLTDHDILISKDGDFALGFFSPDSSNKSFYLGIWYHSIPGARTVVWVANRDDPITTPSSAKLAITNGSQMILSSSEGRNIWATTSNIATGGAEAYAVLLNTGNFVLRLPNTTDIWQSFDHPTDTILPTMKFWMNYKAQVIMRLVAWKGPDDPSSGDFSCSGDPSSPGLQWLIWHGTMAYARGTTLNGVSVTSSPYLSNASSVLYVTGVNLGDEFYFMLTVSNGLPLARVTLDYTGVLGFTSWNNHSSSWSVISENPKAPCDLYASCGPFSYCDLTGTAPKCQCLDGFEPNDFNFSRGCRRTLELKCDKQSRFVTLPRMKVPDKFLHIKNRSFDECTAECTGNCSCIAYAYANAGAATDSSRCLVWTGDLVDTGKTVNYGDNLYLRLTVDKKSSAIKIVLPIVACLLLLTCIALVCFCKYRGKRRKKEIEKKMMLEYFSTSNELEGRFWKSLQDVARKYELDWSTRFKVIKGIARGLLYLHQDSRLTIIHRDLKASNILLDKEMIPKISDFGMARIFDANQNQANTIRVVGTYGYMSPEYVIGGAFSTKSDTYSFGVLLLEIVSGLKISSPQLIPNFSSLITYAWRLWDDKKATELVDSSVVDSCKIHEVLRCIHVGLLCVQDRPDDRPLMSSVMFALENESAVLPAPKQPVYFSPFNYKVGEARENMENSANPMSITTLEGR